LADERRGGHNLFVELCLGQDGEGVGGGIDDGDGSVIGGEIDAAGGGYWRSILIAGRVQAFALVMRRARFF